MSRTCFIVGASDAPDLYIPKGSKGRQLGSEGIKADRGPEENMTARKSADIQTDREASDTPTECSRADDTFLIIAADGGMDHLAEQGIEPDLIMGDFDSCRKDPDPRMASMREETSEHTEEQGIQKGSQKGSQKIIRFPAEKDDTDMALAALEGLQRGCDTFFIYGGLGGARMEHSFGNVQVLIDIAKHGARGFLMGEGYVMTVIGSTGLHAEKQTKNQTEHHAEEQTIKETEYHAEEQTIEETQQHTDACNAVELSACTSVDFPAGLEGFLSLIPVADYSSGITIRGLKYSGDDYELELGNTMGMSNEFTGEKASVSLRSGMLLVIWRESPESVASRFI